MSVNRTFSRRALLRGAAVAAVSSAISQPSGAARPQSHPIDPTQFKARLRGAILSIPTPFTATRTLPATGSRPRRWPVR